MALKGQLKAVENTIERLKKDTNTSGQQVMLQSKLSLAEAHLGVVNTGFIMWKGGLMRGVLRNVKALAV